MVGAARAAAAQTAACRSTAAAACSRCANSRMHTRQSYAAAQTMHADCTFGCPLSYLAASYDDPAAEITCSAEQHSFAFTSAASST